jgi:N-acyl-D-aspartate/D-glutamate deacylase
MPAYDLVIRDGLVGTAADTFACDVGVKNGRIAASATTFPRASTRSSGAGAVH